ncbi:MAG: hypothetical protein ChlgKO_02140 [Chlamydiales bacterium]
MGNQNLLKAHEFDPRDTGQMNFYLSTVDDLIQQPEDNPTIGMILCKTKKQSRSRVRVKR